MFKTANAKYRFGELDVIKINVRFQLALVQAGVDVDDKIGV